jgi:hypothetical protein
VVVVVTMRKPHIAICSAVLHGVEFSPTKAIEKELTLPVNIGQYGGVSQPITVPDKFDIPVAIVKARWR